MRLKPKQGGAEQPCRLLLPRRKLRGRGWRRRIGWGARQSQPAACAYAIPIPRITQTQTPFFLTASNLRPHLAAPSRQAKLLISINNPGLKHGSRANHGRRGRGEECGAHLRYRSASPMRRMWGLAGMRWPELGRKAALPHTAPFFIEGLPLREIVWRKDSNRHRSALSFPENTQHCSCLVTLCGVDVCACSNLTHRFQSFLFSLIHYVDLIDRTVSQM
jgi:hypothetical protein